MPPRTEASSPLRHGTTRLVRIVSGSSSIETQGAASGGLIAPRTAHPDPVDAGPVEKKRGGAPKDAAPN